MAERSDAFHPSGPQNGQAGRLHTTIWESRIRDSHHHLEEYLIVRDRKARLTWRGDYVPAWQPEAPQYMVPNGTLPFEPRVRLTDGHFVRISLNREASRS